MPSSSCRKAPYFLVLVTSPLTIEPGGKRCSIVSQGSSLICRSDSEIRDSSWSSLMTLTSTSSPTDEHLVDRVDAVPAELADVDQAVGAAEVDEGAVGGEAADAALDHVADLELLEELLALAGAVLVHRRLLADDEAVALAVDLEDLDLDLLAQQLLGGVGELAADLAGGQEAAQAEHVDDQAALVLLADLGLDDLAGLLALGGLGPDALGLGAAQRQDDVAVLVLGLEDVDLDLVALVQLDRVGVAAHPQLRGWR